MNTNSHTRWKTRYAAQKVADANNDPDDETADYYLVEEVNGHFVIVVFYYESGKTGLLIEEKAGTSDGPA